MSGSNEAVGRVAMFRSVPLLSSLSEEQLTRLAACAKERSFARGELLVRQGEKGVGLFLLLEGTSEVRRSGRAVSRLRPGQFFGESALLVDQPRTADVLATSDVRCLTLDRWTFWGALGIDPEVNRALFEETTRRLRSFDGEIVE